MLKREQKQLESVLANLQCAKRFIMSDKTVICMRSSGATTIEYMNRQGGHITPITKEVGSDLCGLYNAINALELLLTPQAESGSCPEGVL